MSSISSEQYLFSGRFSSYLPPRTEIFLPSPLPADKSEWWCVQRAHELNGHPETQNNLRIWYLFKSNFYLFSSLLASVTAGIYVIILLFYLKLNGFSILSIVCYKDDLYMNKTHKSEVIRICLLTICIDFFPALSRNAHWNAGLMIL